MEVGVYGLNFKKEDLLKPQGYLHDAILICSPLCSVE